MNFHIEIGKKSLLTVPMLARAKAKSSFLGQPTVHVMSPMIYKHCIVDIGIASDIGLFRQGGSYPKRKLCIHPMF